MNAPARARFVLPALLGVAALGHTQVSAFSLERSSYVNIQPGSSAYFIESTFAATVRTARPADFDAFFVSGPSPADEPRPLVKTGGDYRFFASAGSYPEALLESFPLGDYTFSGTGGALGDGGAVLRDTDAPLSGYPGFLNYEDIQSLSAGQAVSIQVRGVAPRAGATRSYTRYALRLVDRLGNSTTLTEGVHEGSGPFAFGVGAGITQADQYYSIYTEFHSDQTVLDAGFGGATGTISEVNGIGASFTPQAVPEPAGLVALAFGALALVGRRTPFKGR